MRLAVQSRAFLLLLVFLSMLGPLTLNILVPSLPGIAVALGADKQHVQLTLSLFLLGMGVSQLLLGPLADRFGRRPVVLVSLVLYVLASAAAFLAPNVEALILARIVQSFGATAGLTLGRTMIRDLYSRDLAASMIGYVTMGMVLAPMLAPSLGAAIDIHFGWRAILALCTFLGLGSLLMAMGRLPETRPASLRAEGWAMVATRSAGLVGNRRFMAYWGTSTFCSGMFFAFLGAAPYLVIEVMGRDKSEYGLWFMILSLGYMLGNFISGRNAGRVPVDRLVSWGNVTGFAGGLLFIAFALWLPLSPLALFVPAMITSFANGLVLPNAVASAIGVDAKAAGAASGLIGFGQMGFGALLSYVGGHVATKTMLPLALVMLACALLSLLAGWVSRQPTETSPDHV